MGRYRDKHGRTNRDETRIPALRQICGSCGKSAEDMDEHNAIFHPKYREPPKPPSTAVKLRRVADPEQQGLENYLDTAESGDTAAVEQDEDPEQRRGA